MLDRVRRLISRRRDELPDLPEITMRPIGVVRNTVKRPMAHGWEDVRSSVVLRPELAEALLGLDAVDGSPVLDVKPYIPHHDSIPGAEVPRWVTERARHH